MRKFSILGDELFDHGAIIITSNNRIINITDMKVSTGRVRPSLPYQGIARRSVFENNQILYDTEIDISAVIK